MREITTILPFTGPSIQQFQRPLSPFVSRQYENPTTRNARLE